MLTTEIWAPVNVPGNLPYQISTYGNVKRSIPSRFRETQGEFVVPYINNRGYPCVNLYRNSVAHKFLVHRLVALTFIPNPFGFREVNHIDGNPLNPYVGNLEWCTHQYNIQHAWDNGLFINKHACASVKRVNSTSKYHGVWWAAREQKWGAGVTFSGHRYGIGRFRDEIDAAKAYDAFIKAHNLMQYGYKLNFG